MTIFAQSLDWKNFVIYGRKGEYDLHIQIYTEISFKSNDEL